MAETGKFDPMLLALVQQSGGIEPLLEAIFGFLGRKTDFYKYHDNPQVAEDTVLKVFRKCQKQALQDVVKAKKQAEEAAVQEAKRKEKEQLEKRKREEKEKSEKKNKKPSTLASIPKGNFAIEEIESDEEIETDSNKVPQVADDKEEKSEKLSKEERKKVEEELLHGQEPNAGNGGTGPGYTWTQTLADVEIQIPVPPGTRGRQLDISLTATTLHVQLKGSSEPILDGKLCHEVAADDCYWMLDDNKMIVYTIEKRNKMEWWDCIIQGHPTINTSKVEPENSKLSDLDGDTRATVEKMMYDQRQKAAGLPTSEEQEKDRIIKQFMSAHPEMDFSQAKIS